ncbi:uncharacterized protein EDB93DRAFT_610834 [Suillus bovinus]|uniref:uncharacterized protein n=1 Tax=Suillus bovinus TaxID=48563 RepID=UPI001B87BFF9|nr:uncharacterized protein EDB93DRAFT_610834 [Suillus bovinus]KAG2142265.1 hypothetical protein EDB93DRAFT_610834 [Suillus bovinus]
MNTVRSSETIMVHDMLEEYNMSSPILIDRDILRDRDARVTVHPCEWDGCTIHIAVDHKEVSKHLQRHHDINTSATSEDTQQITCRWMGCLDAHMKPGNLTRHILSHLGVRWVCSTCEASLSREDAFRRHSLEKSGCQHAKAIVKYKDGSLVIDTAHLEGGWSALQNVICI